MGGFFWIILKKNMLLKQNFCNIESLNWTCKKNLFDKKFVRQKNFKPRNFLCLFLSFLVANNNELKSDSINNNTNNNNKKIWSGYRRKQNNRTDRKKKKRTTMPWLPVTALSWRRSRRKWSTTRFFLSRSETLLRKNRRPSASPSSRRWAWIPRERAPVRPSHENLSSRGRGGRQPSREYSRGHFLVFSLELFTFLGAFIKRFLCRLIRTRSKCSGVQTRGPPLSSVCWPRSSLPTS